MISNLLPTKQCKIEDIWETGKTFSFHFLINWTHMPQKLYKWPLIVNIVKMSIHQSNMCNRNILLKMPLCQLTSPFSGHTFYKTYILKKNIVMEFLSWIWLYYLLFFVDWLEFLWLQMDKEARDDHHNCHKYPLSSDLLVKTFWTSRSQLNKISM